ncbi:hypothetical protein [Leuconostoc rapi]|uniref:hypothetical protein n=1 Tax=Leuconostoc rapi TaxID=1406906 RepID=UPI001957158E|nr:hypothetical protein [Leuconostoc rapi]MBM7436187.1 hypothetical protein [Leuconostoc rapi]
MSILFKKATIEDIPVISELFYNYFRDFDIFKVSKNRKLLKKAFYKICHLNTIMNVKNENCYLCIDDNKVVGSFVLLSPDEYQKPLFETMVKGGRMLWWHCATVLLSPAMPIIGMLMNKLNASENILLNEDMNTSWFLDALVVKRTKGEYTTVINDVITKIKGFIGQQNGDNLKLLINNDEQLKYFVANKFEIIHKQIVQGKQFRNQIWLLSSGVKK